MKILGNIIWLVFGGLGIAVEYFVSSLLLMITIIGIPFGIATMRLGVFLHCGPLAHTLWNSRRIEDVSVCS